MGDFCADVQYSTATDDEATYNVKKHMAAMSPHDESCADVCNVQQPMMEQNKT
jgi:hypothetical protein